MKTHFYVVRPPGETVHVGCDVHADKYQVALWSSQRADLIGQWVQGADNQVLLSRLDPLKAQVARVVYEAGPTGFGLARALKRAGYAVQVIAASHTPRAGVEQDKCDKRDARQLAQFASQPGMLRPVYIPSEQEEQERQIFRVREQHKDGLRQVKQRIKALLLFHGLKTPEGLRSWSLKGIAALRQMALPQALRWSMDELLVRLEEARAAVMRGNRQLQQLAKTERFKARVDRLRTVPGVGLIVAMGVLLELPSPGRFADRRALSRFVGLCPKVCSTGSHSWSEGRPEVGQAILRALLVEAAWRWVRGDAYAKKLFSRYLANTAMRNKAIVAVAHKLLVILWRLILGELPYVPGLMRVPKATVGPVTKGKATRKGRPPQGGVRHSAGAPALS
jgi:transposase